MGWNYLSINKRQRRNRWSLGMDKWFHPTLYRTCDNLSMLIFKLIHVSKSGPRCQNKTSTVAKGEYFVKLTKFASLYPSKLSLEIVPTI